MTIEQLPFSSRINDKREFVTTETTFLNDIERKDTREIPKGVKLTLLTLPNYGLVALPPDMESPRFYRY